MVDRSQGIQLANPRSVRAVLDVVQPSAGDEKILILLFESQLFAERFHLPQGESETFS
jgi:hypothetical protein